jgi:hypothetical protein
MKIRPDEIAKATVNQQTRKTTKEPAERFSEILKRTMDSPSVSKQAPATAQPPFTVSQIQLDAISTDDRSPVLDRIERVLDGLETYTTRLAETSVPPSQLEPLVAQLEAQNAELTAELQGLPDGDPLKDLLNRVLVTSVVEVEKFRRGDFL